MKYFYACVLFFNFIFVTARITFSSYKCFNQNVSSLFQVLLTLNRWIMKINYLPNQEDQEDSLLTISVFALILPFNPRKRCSRNVWGCSSPLSWQGSARYETMAAVSGVSLWQQQDLLTPSLLHLHSHLTLTLCPGQTKQQQSVTCWVSYSGSGNSYFPASALPMSAGDTQLSPGVGRMKLYCFNVFTKASF